MEQAKKRRRRYPIHRPAIEAGRVVGTLKHGVSVTRSYQGEVTIRVGLLGGWQRADGRSFEMTAAQAGDLGVRLLEEAARAKLDREQHIIRKRQLALFAKRRAEKEAAQVAAS